jgi:NAD(P)-dependent dehydrogenase (short-subunit alcohol dehydrogenase family)
VSNAKEVRKSIQSIVLAYGKPDILVNNAGVLLKETSIMACSERTFDAIIDTNLRGAWLTMKHTASRMKRCGGGCIVNVSSIGAMQGLSGIGVYSASKAALIALSRVAAIEFSKCGIRVNCVCPGVIDTPLITNTMNSRLIKHLGRLPLWKRMGKPEEIANIILFLVSDESSWITGETIVADGGVTIQHR